MNIATYEKSLDRCIRCIGVKPRRLTGIFVFDYDNNIYRDVTDAKLKASLAPHRIATLDIDKSWDPIFKADDKTEIQDRLAMASYRTRNGALILNITDIRIFGYCWYLKQLVKQERPLRLSYDSPKVFDIFELKQKAEMMNRKGRSAEEIEAYVGQKLKEAAEAKQVPNDFNGFVIFYISGMTLKDIADYAYEHFQEGEFGALTSFGPIVID